MRWIVLLLLVANIGLFAWFQSSGGASTGPVAESPPLPRGAAGITLVRELPPGARPPAPAPGAAQRAEGKLCTLFGPFAESYQGEDLVQRMRALQVEAALREVEMSGPMRFWVFLPPLDSRREAFRRLRELQAAGVDSYVIPSGSLANGISFGIFSEPERAESLARELRQKGFAAQTRQEPQTFLEQWVVLPPGGAEQLAEDFWSQLQLEYPELDRRQNLCSEVGH